ncbi:hypothetical protein Pelo_16525 [Pelomyxa schiedti]|nr:hypothetical protein Pelo_16525 [Pelomyxa schiedti]
MGASSPEQCVDQTEEQYYRHPAAGISRMLRLLLWACCCIVVGRSYGDNDCDSVEPGVLSGADETGMWKYNLSETVNETTKPLTSGDPIDGVIEVPEEEKDICSLKQTISYVVFEDSEFDDIQFNTDSFVMLFLRVFYRETDAIHVKAGMISFPLHWALDTWHSVENFWGQSLTLVDGLILGFVGPAMCSSVLYYTALSHNRGSEDVPAPVRVRHKHASARPLAEAAASWIVSQGVSPSLVFVVFSPIIPSGCGDATPADAAATATATTCGNEGIMGAGGGAAAAVDVSIYGRPWITTHRLKCDPIELLVLKSGVPQCSDVENREWWYWQHDVYGWVPFESYVNADITKTYGRYFCYSRTVFNIIAPFKGYAIDLSIMSLVNTQAIHIKSRPVRRYRRDTLLCVPRMKCQYGLPPIDNIQAESRKIHSVCQFCICQCHKNQIFADGIVHTLCVVSLVSKRFNTPLYAFGRLTIPNEAARRICACLGSLTLHFPSWKEQLLLCDPKVKKRQEDQKLELHKVAFWRTTQYWSMDTLPLYSLHFRNWAKAAILARWGKIDQSLQEFKHSTAATTYIGY